MINTDPTYTGIVRLPEESVKAKSHAGCGRAGWAGVIEGKVCTAYPAVGPEVTEAGGKFEPIDVDRATVDGKLVTAPAWPAHAEWLAKFLVVLGTKIEP